MVHAVHDLDRAASVVDSVGRTVKACAGVAHRNLGAKRHRRRCGAGVLAWVEPVALRVQISALQRIISRIVGGKQRLDNGAALAAATAAGQIGQAEHLHLVRAGGLDGCRVGLALGGGSHLLERRDFQRHCVPCTAVVMLHARNAEVALDAKRRRVKPQHHAACHLITAPNLGDGAGLPYLVGVFEQVFDHLAEHSRAGVLRYRFDALHKAVALDGCRVAGLCADVRLAVVLGGNDNSVVGVLGAVLAAHLTERPGDIKRRNVFRRLVHRLDRRCRQRLDLQTAVVHAVAVLLAGRRRAGVQHIADNVSGRTAGPQLRDLGRQAAHLADCHARLGTRLADDLIGGEVVDLQHDFALIKIPSAVISGYTAVQRHRDNDAGKDRFALIGHAHLIARRECQLGRVLVPRTNKRLKRQLCRQRVKVIGQGHATRKRGDVARLCAVAVQDELVLVYIACRHAAHLLM